MPRIFDIIEAPDQGLNQMVYRVPPSGSGDFRIGSQVVVRENQTAVFFRDGKALDTFGPGRHTITTANIPLLVNLLGLAFSGSTPFKAEVYFVNMRDFIDMKWGTPEPITLRDKELGMVRLRANGRYSMAVEDPQMFVTKIVGTQGLFQTSQIEDYLRGIIISRLTDLIGETMGSIFDLPAKFDEVSAAIRVKVADDFSQLGIQLKQMFLGSVSPTEETQKAIDERASMGAIGNMQAYMQYQAAKSMRDAANQPAGEGGGGGASTGVGLGAGFGLGAGMAGMISQAMQGGGQQVQPPAGGQGQAGGGPAPEVMT
ncbi:MAG: SPFH domain-containing protein, partial [Nitrososphaerales archaeon]